MIHWSKTHYRASADRSQIRPTGNASSERRGYDRAVPPGLVLYCDGACEPNPGAGGWGFVAYQDGVELHAESGGSVETTNNIMELTGALMAMRWYAQFGSTNPLGVRLFCDSQYVVKGCNEWRHTWKRNGWSKRKPNSPKRAEGEIKNLGLWKELDAALMQLPLTLEWCKGHAGIIGNERADELSLIGRAKALETQVPASLDIIRQQLDYSARGGA